jgi:23S rRNA pseudouridine1911/1915/1917 synthase
MGSDSTQRLTLTVPDDMDGVRADRVVAALSGLTRSRVKGLFGEGGVTRSGEPLTHREPLAAGDTVEVIVPELDDQMHAEPIELDVVFEDEHLLVINKPAGLVVHPGAGRATGTLVHGLLHRWPEIRGVGQPGRWGIVHRLDRGTSGALLVAKTHDAYFGLRSAIDAREVARRYLCLVYGPPEMPTGTVDAPIGRDVRQPTRMRVTRDGRPAVTHYRVVEEWEDIALLAVTLETGRTHQIRVHLQSVGLPVLGDRTYGRPGPEGIDPGRPWLHAAELALLHPVTSVPMDVSAPLPEDLAHGLEVLRANG